MRVAISLIHRTENAERKGERNTRKLTTKTKLYIYICKTLWQRECRWWSLQFNKINPLSR